MGTFLSHLFVDVETLPHDGYGFVQLLFLAAVYGYVLCISSGMISDGSELLLLVPAFAGIVGSVVLPVLGAVPDGAIVLFSGLGADAQKQLTVGIGALAGSTIMLLTVPWCLSIIGGRVDLDENGNGNYVRPKGAKGWSKLTRRFFGTGVNVGPSIKYSSKVMLLTLITYFIIQVPSFVGDCGEKKQESDCKSPRLAAIIGAVFATLLFLFYLWDQARIADQDEVKEDKIDQIRQSAVNRHLVSLRGLFPSQVIDSQGVVPLNAESKRFQSFLRPFFRQFDVDNSGAIDKNELALLLNSLGEKATPEKLTALMTEMDSDGSGSIDFDEFCKSMAMLIEKGGQQQEEGGTSAPLVQSSGERSDNNNNAVQNNSSAEPTEEDEDEDEDEDEEEEAEMPEDLANLSPREQQFRLIRRSFTTMGIGVLVVLLFSDPMVDVLSELGSRTHIPPFYVAFCLAPLASNASELIAAYNYALKKTEKTITISFSSLIGAACMNNTFCLCIFLYLVYFKNLKWVFSAETISILVIELMMFVVAQKRIHPTYLGFVVLCFFPLAIAVVAVLENAAGLD